MRLGLASIGFAGLIACSSPAGSGSASSDAATTTTAVPTLGAETLLADSAGIVELKELPNGHLLLVGNNREIREVDANLEPVAFTIAPAPDYTATFLVDDGASILYVGASQMWKVSATTGAASPAFGNGGTAIIPVDPGSLAATGQWPGSLACGQGNDGTVGLVLNEMTDDTRTLALAVVEPTGALTKKVTLTLPSGADVEALMPLHDGNFALVLSQQDPARTRAHYSVIRTSGGEAGPALDLVAGPGWSEDGTALDSVRELADGSLRLVFDDMTIDTPTALTGQLFEVSLAANATTPVIHALGDGNSVEIPSIELSCGPSTVQTGDAVWSARSTIAGAQFHALEVSATGIDGAPRTATIGLANRCVTGLFATPSGHVFVETLDVTNDGVASYLTRVD